MNNHQREWAHRFFSKDNCSNNKANLTFTIRVINTTSIRKNHDNNEFRILIPGSNETRLNRFCTDALFQKIPINKVRMCAYWQPLHKSFIKNSQPRFVNCYGLLLQASLFKTARSCQLCHKWYFDVFPSLSVFAPIRFQRW